MRRIIFSAITSLWCISSAVAQEPQTLVVLTHDSFAISEPVLQAFEEASGSAVEILRAGDAGQMVNQAILSVNNPLGDLLYGVDNTFLSRALEAGIFASYKSPALQNVAAEFLPGAEDLVTPVNFGDVCLNYDIAHFEENALALPQNLRELARPEYAPLLVVENPATSSPGLAFLLTTIAAFGEEGDFTYLDYWRMLRDNGVLVVDGWTDAYYGQFTVGSRGLGSRPLVVSYASSPPAEVYFGEDQDAPAVTGAIVHDDMCFRQIEYVGLLAGAVNQRVAQQFVDFMLSAAFQADMPLNMFVFPVVEDIELPGVFAEHARIPANPVALAPALIEERRDDWIQAWAEVMLR